MRESASTDLREPQGSNPLGPPGPELHSPLATRHSPLATRHPPYPTPSSATRNWLRFACVICYDLLRFPGFLKSWRGVVFFSQVIDG
jgi:hypothetical protein